MTTILIALALLALLVAVFLPRAGLWSRWREARRLAARCRREDSLKHILKCEADGQTATAESLAGVLGVRPNEAAELLAGMEAHGLISYEEGRLRLQPAGRDLGLHIIRAHRLWESYLAERTGVSEAEWHLRAEKQEHLLSRQQANALAAQLGHPARDPHGDVIPAEDGEFKADTGRPLNSVPLDTPVVISHIEDEPETIYAQLCAQGLRAGMKACVIEKTPQRIRFWADGNEHVLAPILANNISVAPLPDFKVRDLFEEEYLSSMHPGRRAKVLGLSPACRGAERRRLLDLGFVPGTAVEIEMVSPGGDPTAYRVRGTVIALRREQAGLIRISTQEAAPA